MLIHTRSRDGRFIGLHIGQDNVRRHFPAAWSSIELLLGHLHIHCDLAPSFWKDEPSVFDPRLADWLESQCRGSQRGACITLNLTAAGEACFRVELQRNAPRPLHPAGARRHQHASPSSGDD
jgi:hypothetical protein